MRGGGVAAGSGEGSGAGSTRTVSRRVRATVLASVCALCRRVRWAGAALRSARGPGVSAGFAALPSNKESCGFTDPRPAAFRPLFDVARNAFISSTKRGSLACRIIRGVHDTSGPNQPARSARDRVKTVLRCAAARALGDGAA